MARQKQVSSTRYGQYRSGLEFRIAQALDAQSLAFEYEQRKLWFVQPAIVKHYTPDFILPNGIIIEAKGRFLTDDRQKHKFVKVCHPKLDIRFVFSNENAAIGKGSPTTYAMWCERYGFAYAGKLVPSEWTNEPHCEKRWAAIEGAYARDKKAATQMFQERGLL